MNISKLIVTLSAAVLMAESNASAQISFDTKNIVNGEYSYMYSDGLYSKEETGKLDSEGNPVVSGQFRYVVGDKEYVVTYTADKDGFHPKVTTLDHLGPPQVVFSAPSVLVATLLGK
ncbi:hypothetical protein ABMA28_015650 [Loxostege sticticalis]|uniref:Uncharacterized protein n=1 Tax=Loxostege sticticalis TaxID=481309 RepID=A0ABD0TAJ6_LOXSC